MFAPPVVAVIDSGWNRALTHRRVDPGVCLLPDKEGRLVLGDDDHDRHGHGTACARLILRRTHTARVVPIRIFDTSLIARTEQLVLALDYSMRRGANIVSLSLSCSRDEHAEVIMKSCLSMADRGTVIVAAKQNHCAEGFPADLPYVIGVSAVKQGETLPDECSTHENPSVKVQYVPSAEDPFQRNGWLSNSFATAAVVGAIARSFEQHEFITPEVFAISQQVHLSQAYMLSK